MEIKDKAVSESQVNEWPLSAADIMADLDAMRNEDKLAFFEGMAAVLKVCEERGIPSLYIFSELFKMSQFAVRDALEGVKCEAGKEAMYDAIYQIMERDSKIVRSHVVEVVE